MRNGTWQTYRTNQASALRLVHSLAVHFRQRSSSITVADYRVYKSSYGLTVLTAPYAANNPSQSPETFCNFVEVHEAQRFDLRFLHLFCADLSIRKSSSFLPP